MRVCVHNGHVIAVLTRNEHCPPHVHVKDARWDARFEFAFWDDGVRLMDVTPVHHQPTVAVLESLRQAIGQPVHLRKARELWWATRQTLCLENQSWDRTAHEAVAPRSRRRGAIPILSGFFDPVEYRTVLSLVGQADPLEIQL